MILELCPFWNIKKGEGSNSRNSNLMQALSAKIIIILIFTTMRAILYRKSKTDKQTLGEIQVGDLTLFTLELPDLNNDGIEGNEVRKSCIPDGVYPVVRHTSPKFGRCFWVRGVPGRSAILIHPGNYYYHTLGCILVGMDQRDLNDDDLIDNVSSKKAMAKLLDYDIEEIEIKTV